MQNVDLFLIDCWRDGATLVQDCRACDWRDILPLVSDLPGKLTCPVTDESMPIIHRIVEIDMDIDVIRQPQEPVLTPCCKVDCHT